MTERIGALGFGERKGDGCFAAFTGESAMCSCAIALDGRTIIAMDKLGRAYFLRLVEADETKLLPSEIKIPLMQRQEQGRSATNS
jgi:hypothetical protein